MFCESLQSTACIQKENHVKFCEVLVSSIIVQFQIKGVSNISLLCSSELGENIEANSFQKNMLEVLDAQGWWRWGYWSIILRKMAQMHRSSTLFMEVIRAYEPKLNVCHCYVIRLLSPQLQMPHQLISGNNLPTDFVFVVNVSNVLIFFSALIWALRLIVG